MIFNRHLDLKGQHAFLSASKYSWIRYTPEKLEESFLNYTAAQRGTELHDFARRCIALGVNLPKANRTLNLYVNDAIRYEMTPEQTLYYCWIDLSGCGDADGDTEKRWGNRRRNWGIFAGAVYSEQKVWYDFCVSVVPSEGIRRDCGCNFGAGCSDCDSWQHENWNADPRRICVDRYPFLKKARKFSARSATSSVPS